MPIDISEFREPKLSKLKGRYPMSYDKKDRFHNFETNMRSYRNPDTNSEEGGFKQGGYNPNHNSTRIEKVNLFSDNITLKPY
jgi:hypothetical protein